MFHLEPRSPLPLALLRIALALFVLWSPELEVAVHVAEQGKQGLHSLWIAPEGLQWLVPALDGLEPLVRPLSWATRICAVAVLVGLFTRWSLALLAVGVYFTFGIAQLRGTVTHNMHLWWLIVLLACGPGDYGISLDAWRKKKPLFCPTASIEAARTLVGARLLLALVYLFPGIAKLRVSGLDWASSENLQNQLRLKWVLAEGWVPWPRIDEWATVLQMGGVGVLVFELGFVLAIWSKPGRWFAVVAGLCFHALTAHFFYIHFVGLWGCYVVFWDGPRVAPARETRHGAASSLLQWSRLSWFSSATLALLIVGVVVQGVRGQTQSWPFACYPDFAHRSAPYITDLAVDVVLPNGTIDTLRPPRRRPSGEWGTVWRILGLYDGRPNQPALRAYAAQRLHLDVHLGRRASERGIGTDGSARVRYMAEDYSTDPDEYGGPPLRRRLVFEQ